MYYYKKIDSPIGELTIAVGEKEIVGLWMKDQKYYGEPINEKMYLSENHPLFEVVENWLVKYFSGLNPRIDNLPLSPIGSKFRQDVWKILCQIPYGEVITYRDIAKRLGNSMSAQAVGGAVGHNPISIIIPCHRVVGTNKSLTGYAGGISKKIKLLELEGLTIKDNVVL